MKVTSYYDPIIIDGEKINQPSDYLSASGEDFYEARGRKRFFKRKWTKFVPPVAIVKGVRKGAKRFLNANGISGGDFYDFDGDTMSNLDGTNTTEVKAFQDWLDKKGLKWVKATDAQLTNGEALNKGFGYGNFGESTKKAYEVYGNDWEKFKKTALMVLTAPSGANLNQTTTTPPTGSTPPIVNQTQTPVQEEKPKAKGNMLVYGGIGLAVLLIIVAVALPKNKPSA